MLRLLSCLVGLRVGLRPEVEQNAVVRAACAVLARLGNHCRSPCDRRFARKDRHDVVRRVRFDAFVRVPHVGRHAHEVKRLQDRRLLARLAPCDLPPAV